MPEKFDFDIAIIGAGVAGSTVAKKAADLGFKVALVDKVKAEANVQGYASFVDNYTIDVDREKITAKKICIATGSKPDIPAIDGLEGIDCLTEETISSLEKAPESITVIGGGKTGLKLAQTYARSGSKVTVMETLEHLFIKEYPEAGSLMEKVLSEKGINLILGANVRRAYLKDGKKAVAAEHQGQEKEFIADEIIAATGRIPNVIGLDLELARVEYTKKGINVDDRLRTTASNIWACGDVVGPFRYFHMAEYQAQVAADNMIFRFSKRLNYDFVPWCMFTDPQVAHIGLTEELARQKGIKYETVREDSEAGFLKLLISKDKIVGAVCVGPDAGNTIHELILAASAKLPLHKISNAIHIYPALAQINQRAVRKYLTQKRPGPFTKKLAKSLFNLFS